MQKLIDLFYRFLEILLIVLLSGMALMVFVNVIMRYGFNSGLNISDELSRYFFVWLTFIQHHHHRRFRDLLLGHLEAISDQCQHGRARHENLDDLGLWHRLLHRCRRCDHCA
jgi:hypothetical protein